MKLLDYSLVLLFLAVTVVSGHATSFPVSHEGMYGHPPVVPTMPRSVRAEVGAHAPLFDLDAVVNQEFKRVRLVDYRGKWVVLFFYPGDFTFVCPTEIKGFNKALAEFKAVNTEVLAVSTDSKYSHLGWIKSGSLDKLNYPLVSDFTKQTARAYGVLDEAQGTARRGLFIIDPQGVIQHVTVNNDKVGRSIDETLRVLKALQTDELCPLNWRPGDKTIGK